MEKAAQQRHQIPGAEALNAEEISDFYVEQTKRMMEHGVETGVVHVGILTAALAMNLEAVGPVALAQWLHGIAESLDKVGRRHLN